MAEESELDKMLHELARAGEHHSAGSFSVDLRRAVRKISEFHHDDRLMFLRHILSAAVMLEAHTLRVDTGLLAWKFVLEGPTLTFDEICHVFPSLSIKTPGRRGVALRELALALTNLMGMVDVKVFLHCAQAELRMDSRRLRVSPNRGKSSPHVTLEVHGLNWWERLTTPGLTSDQWIPRILTRPDLEAFRTASQYTRLRPVINGTVLPRKLVWDSRFSARCQGIIPLPEVTFLHPPLWDKTDQGQISLLLGLTSGSVSLMCQGALFEYPSRWPIPCRVLLMHDGLQKDLLGSTLIDNANLRSTWTTLEAQLLLLLASALAEEGPETGRLREELTDVWLQGNLPLEWLSLPFLQPGGWPQPCSPDGLSALCGRQGFLDCDPTLTSAPTLLALKKICPQLISTTPYVPLTPLEGDWLLRVPTPFGELRYRGQWPLQPARCYLKGEEFADSSLTYLPAGLEVWLRYPPYQQRFRPEEHLFWAFQLRLKHAPDCFLGSAPALSLALWLSQTVDAPPLAFPLRTVSGSHVGLQSVLELAHRYKLEERAGTAFDRYGTPVVLLSQAELELLSPLAKDLQPAHDGSLDLSQLNRDFPPELYTNLLRQLSEQLAARRACFLLYQAELHQLQFMAGLGMEDFKRGTALDGQLTLTSVLLQQVSQATPVRSSMVHPSLIGGRLNVSKIRSYLSGLLVWPGGQGLLYFERELRVGVFGETELEALAQILVQASAILGSAHTGSV